MLTLHTAKILVVSPNETDQAYMQDFFDRIDGIIPPTFVVSKFVSADKYDFIVFDCRTMPIYKVEEFVNLPEEIQSHFFLLDRYIRDTTKNIVFFGRYYHNLNFERCPSANSKFTLFARIRELIDFINHYRPA
jgi:hypothetical protein